MKTVAAVLLVVPLVIGALERLAIPSVALEHPVWTERSPGSETAVDHGAWAAFLESYRAVDGEGVARVDYGAVTPADRAALDGYIAALEAVEVPALAADEQLAFWINLYNAVTVRTVLDAYPVASIRDIGGGLFGSGPWADEAVTVMGRTLSLNDIEHGIIRAVWDEPRIHYAVNCAAIGCPNLAAEPFAGEALDARLAEAERAFVNDPRGVRLEGRDLVLSKIFFWFREDWAPDEAALLNALRPVATGRTGEALAGRQSVARYDYDWALNDQATASGG